MKSEQYQWFVRRGRIGMFLDEQPKSTVTLDVDPEGSKFCVLKIQDAAEISAILGSLAEVLSQRIPAGDERRGAMKTYSFDESGAMTWPLPHHPLEIQLNDAKTFVRFGPPIAVSYEISLSVCFEIQRFLKALVGIASKSGD